MLPFRLAGTAALAIAVSSPASAQAAPVQTIDLVSYSYAPSPIRLRAGQPVTLLFVNRAGKSHDFTAKRFFRSARIVAGQPPEGEIELGPGRSASVTLIPVAGTYKVHCGHPFHKMLGMRTEIVVQ